MTTKPNFNAPQEIITLAFNCGKRAAQLYVAAGVQANHMGLALDLLACHCNGMPLNFKALWEASDNEFMQDVMGVNQNICRATGVLLHGYIPRHGINVHVIERPRPFVPLRCMIAVDGTITILQRAHTWEEIEDLLECEGIGTIYLLNDSKGRVILVDEDGIENGLPVNPLATELYLAFTDSAESDGIRGVVVIVPESDLI